VREWGCKQEATGLMENRMTRHQESFLSVVKPENLAALMAEYSFEYVGPSRSGSILFREPNGQAWLLSDFRGKVAPVRIMFRTIWSDQNVACIRCNCQ
jgi:hypothetical protein